MLDKMMKHGGSMCSRPVGGLETPQPPAGSAAAFTLCLDLLACGGSVDGNGMREHGAGPGEAQAAAGWGPGERG